MSDAAAPLPCAGSAHLSLLVDEVDRLSIRLHKHVTTAPAGVLAARRDEDRVTVADASLRLDGGLRASRDGTGIERPGTWLDALGGTVTDTGEAGAPVGEDELERLAQLEQAGVLAGADATDLTEAFGRSCADPSGLGTALTLLHGRITAGLVADERAGALRRGPRVVHDASVGRVLFFPTDPSILADAWDQLLRHVTGTGAGAAAARAPAAVRAALLHLELLRHQPFDAANGRIARAAARLALMADGLLPEGLAAPDPVLAEDPLGYHEEVGASVRRRDATRWTERTLEAQGIALLRTIDALDTPGAPADRGSTSDTPPPTLSDHFTLGDVIETVGGTSDAARERCSGWITSGHVERVVGSSGLRFRRRGATTRR